MPVGAAHLGRLLAATLLGVGLLAAPARADPAITRFATFLHAGPAKQSAAIDEIPTRTVIDVAGCDGDWCRVRFGGGEGWVAKSMLVPSAPGAAGPVAAPAECFDFVRSGWPNAGDLDRLCIHAPVAGSPAAQAGKPGD